MTIDIDEVVKIEKAASSRDVLLFELGLVDVERGLVAALEQVDALPSQDQMAGAAGDEHTPYARIQFAQGTLLALGALCATLIGKGVLTPEDAEELVDRIETTAAIWLKHNCPLRALPSEMLADRLREMIITRREVDQQIAASRGTIRSARVQ